MMERPWTKDWEKLEGAQVSFDGDFSPIDDDISIVTGCSGEGADWDYSGEIQVTGEGALANARLIAASPDLFEALEALADKVADETDASLRPVFNAEMRRARAALNKALGKEE